MRRWSVLVAVMFSVVLLGAVPAVADSPMVNTGPASNIWANTAVLNGTVDPGGSALTSCQFKYGPAMTFPSGASVINCQYSQGTTGVYAVLTHLFPDSQYDFLLTASDAGGTSTGATHTFSTNTTPPPPPTATTQAASGAEPTTATLHGTVDPKYVAVTNCYFEYGSTTSYRSYAPCSPPPQSAGSESLSSEISGLEPNATYHFQVVITTVGGTAKGGDQTFTTTSSTVTPGSPSGQATTARPTAVTATTATLHGVVNAEGQAGDRCTFYYGTGTGYQSNIPCSPGHVTGSSAQGEKATIRGLRPRTSYHFAIVLQTAGDPVDGKVVNFKTETAPRARTGRATRIRTHSVLVHGRVNGEGSHVISCQFLYARASFRHGTPRSAHRASCVPRPRRHGVFKVDRRLRRLRSRSRYYYRVVIRTQAGSARGAVRSFRTGR